MMRSEEMGLEFTFINHNQVRLGFFLSDKVPFQGDPKMQYFMDYH